MKVFLKNVFFLKRESEAIVLIQFQGRKRQSSSLLQSILYIWLFSVYNSSYVFNTVIGSLEVIGIKM